MKFKTVRIASDENHEAIPKNSNLKTPDRPEMQIALTTPQLSLKQFQNPLKNP